MLIHNFYFKSPWFSSKILHGFASIFRHANSAVPCQDPEARWPARGARRHLARLHGGTERQIGHVDGAQRHRAGGDGPEGSGGSPNGTVMVQPCPTNCYFYGFISWHITAYNLSYRSDMSIYNCGQKCKSTNRLGWPWLSIETYWNLWIWGSKHVCLTINQPEMKVSTTIKQDWWLYNLLLKLMKANISTPGDLKQHKTLEHNGAV